MNTGLGILGRHPLGRVLELEAVREDQVVSLGRVGTQRLVLLRRRPRLDMADGQAQRIADLLQSLVGPGIPGGVGDGPGRDEPDPNSRGCRGRVQPDNATSMTARSHNQGIGGINLVAAVSKGP